MASSVLDLSSDIFVAFQWFETLNLNYHRANGPDEKIDVNKVAVSMNGIELRDHEFFGAIREAREPNASVAQALPCYRVLQRLERHSPQASR
jgi:hypothetical protein